MIANEYKTILSINQKCSDIKIFIGGIKILRSRKITMGDQTVSLKNNSQKNCCKNSIMVNSGSQPTY